MKIKVPSLDNVSLEERKIFIVNTTSSKAEGEFNSLSAAIEEASKFKPSFKNGQEIVCEVKIKSGSIITDRIMAIGVDLSHIVITSENDQIIKVDASNWVQPNGHFDYEDYCAYSQNTVPFIAGENRAQLPIIGCVFSLNNEPIYANIKKDDKEFTLTSGYYASRGSSGLILAGCGFINFTDNIFSTHDSSIVAHSAKATGAKRYGLHARHNGEIAARGIDLSGSLIGAYADKIADIDIREAQVVAFNNTSGEIESQCTVGVWAKNLSRINAGNINFSGLKGINVTISTSEVNSEKIINNAVNVFDVDIDDSAFEIIEDIEIGVIHCEIGSTVNVYKCIYDTFNKVVDDEFSYQSQRYLIKNGGTIIANKHSGKNLSSQYNYNVISTDGIIYA